MPSVGAAGSGDFVSSGSVSGGCFTSSSPGGSPLPASPSCSVSALSSVLVSSPGGVSSPAVGVYPCQFDIL